MAEDSQGVQFLHNDVVVVTLNMENYDVRYILIDYRSLVDVYIMMLSSKWGYPLSAILSGLSFSRIAI